MNSRTSDIQTAKETTRHSRTLRPGVLVLWALLALVAFCGFVALGTWQVHRLHWKHDLIARVTQRIHAPAVPAPGRSQWAGINEHDDAYRRVMLHGVFLNQDETFVQATTALGPGFWVLTPLRRDDGSYVLVNRGFVSPAHRDPATRGALAPQGEVTVTGLLRVTEPGGAFLRKNNPANDRWFSRDVQAIADKLGLSPIAPYFVDQQASAGAPAVNPMQPPSVWPVPGLTVVHFRDSHLSYAITWYILALMVAAASFYVVRIELRQRRRRADHQAGRKS